MTSPKPDRSTAARDFLSAGEPGLALEAARVALPDDPASADLLDVWVSAALRLGRLDEAAAALAITDAPAAEQHRQASRLAMAEGNDTQGIAAARLAAKAAPQSAAAAHQLGVCLAHTHQHHAALEELHRALELDDRRPHSWSALAAVYHAEGSLSDALFATTEAAKLAPTHAGIQHRHAQMLAAHGEVEAAARVLHAALGHNPGNPALESELTRLLDRPISATFLAWISLWMLLMGVSLLLGVALDPMVGGICFLFLLVGMVVWGASFSEDSERSRIEQASPGVLAAADAIRAGRDREARTRHNPWNPPET